MTYVVSANPKIDVIVLFILVCLDRIAVIIDRVVCENYVLLTSLNEVPVANVASDFAHIRLILANQVS